MNINDLTTVFLFPGQRHHPCCSPRLETRAGDERDSYLWVYLPRGEMNAAHFRLDPWDDCYKRYWINESKVKWVTVFILLRSVGVLAAPGWHARHSRTPADGAGRPGWHPDPSLLSHSHALRQHLGGQHGDRRASLHWPGTSSRSGAVPLPAGLSGPVLSGTTYGAVLITTDWITVS